MSYDTLEKKINYFIKLAQAHSNEDFLFEEINNKLNSLKNAIASEIFDLNNMHYYINITDETITDEDTELNNYKRKILEDKQKSFDEIRQIMLSILTKTYKNIDFIYKLNKADVIVKKLTEYVNNNLDKYVDFEKRFGKAILLYLNPNIKIEVYKTYMNDNSIKQLIRTTENIKELFNMYQNMTKEHKPISRENISQDKTGF